MTLVLIILGAMTLLELLLWLPFVWRWRKPLAIGILLGLAVSSGWLIGKHISLWSLLFGVFSGYRVVNLLRLIEDRVHGDYLFHSSRRASVLLILAQLFILTSAALNYHYHGDALLWGIIITTGSLLGAVISLLSTLRHLKTTRPPEMAENYADRDLPTLSVVIPARNETDDLEACLQSLVGSDYPKLEILVLDDCSQQRRTPEIIRGFAQDGVRFIAGTLPPEQWLAKNYAYQQLVDASSGEILLFCGVDVRFEPDSLRSLIEIMLQKKKAMLSVIPRNLVPDGPGLEALLVQPSRYAWELSLPRRLVKRPAVLSTCWLIKRDLLLHKAGGFEAITHSISPESYLARQAMAADDGYAFVQSDASIALSCVKSLSQQRQTAIRTRYPQLHRRPELVTLLSLTELMVLVLPFGLAIGGLLTRHWLLFGLSCVSSGLLCAMYAAVVRLTYQSFLWRSLVLLPFAALYDVCLLNYSLWRYEFRDVIWKDRNVCLPVMRVIPSLPKLDR